MRIIVKRFDQLTNKELYDLLQLRSEVFVVEQQCIYQDPDGKDQLALHVLGYDNYELVAYARAFRPGDYFKEASIGRVVVKENSRARGLAYEIMKAAMDSVRKHFKSDCVALSAQTYLKDFYNKIGFREKGKEYLEDGIPHILMINDKSS